MLNSLLSRLCIVLIKGYQGIISPYLPNACRYSPTCSQYGVEAYTKYGFFKGSILTLKRISRCHPWGGKGYDPLP